MGAWGSLGGIEGRCRRAVEGVEAGREAGLNESSDSRRESSLTGGLLDQLLVD